MLLLAGATATYAQVKIGANAKTIGSASNLEVEAANGNKTIVDKATGQVTIQDGTQGTNKILTSDANGASSWQPLASQPSFPIKLTSLFNGLILPKSNLPGNVSPALNTPTSATTTNGIAYTYTMLTNRAASVSSTQYLAPLWTVKYTFITNIFSNGSVADMILLLPQNTTGLPDNFSVNLIQKTANTLTISIVRTDGGANGFYGSGGDFLLDLVAFKL
ncbi:hypothetical protein [uncultured Fibrella sp.]|uniref:hypothetical protein n=1 Tax=uncultured Fibrella sp. TaxID=1284596 RepID=UPI0035C9CC4F